MRTHFGRPSVYTPEMAERICERLATSRLGLEEVLADIPDAPHMVTVYRWLEAHPDFCKKYSRARELQADYMADLIAQEAYTPRIGVIRKSTPKGEEETIADNVERSKLIVSALFKRSSQLAPKKYGERLAHVGGDGGPIEVEVKDARAKLAERLGCAAPQSPGE